MAGSFPDRPHMLKHVKHFYGFFLFKIFGYVPYTNFPHLMMAKRKQIFFDNSKVNSVALTIERNVITLHENVSTLSFTSFAPIVFFFFFKVRKQASLNITD